MSNVLHWKQNPNLDYELKFESWSFIITELVGGDTDYVFRVYVENKNLYVYGGGYIELPNDYKTLKGAKTAVANFLLKNCCFKLL